MVSHPSPPCTKTDVSNRVELKGGNWRRGRSVYLHSRFLELRCRPLSMLLWHEATNYYCLISITIYPCQIGSTHAKSNRHPHTHSSLVGLSGFYRPLISERILARCFASPDYDAVGSRGRSVALVPHPPPEQRRRAGKYSKNGKRKSSPRLWALFTMFVERVSSIQPFLCRWVSIEFTKDSSSLQRRTLLPIKGSAHRIMHDFEDLCM